MKTKPHNNEVEQAITIFYKAATYIRRFGWQEKGMSEYGRPRCSMGALVSANPELVWNPKVASLMYDALYKNLDGLTLTQFNRRAKDGEDVAALFTQTADLLKKSTV